MKIKQLEFKDYHGLFACYVYQSENAAIFFTIDLAFHMDCNLWSDNYTGMTTQIWYLRAEEQYNKQSRESPKDYCIRRCQEYWNDFLSNFIEME